MYGTAAAMSNTLIIRSGECKKFSPNIFNKTKCTNCFRQKEEHSAEALESNRATRKVAKCGYLFVAPGWDFSNPVNRTKRWQRRWFVLYDDGELSYSVDEHPETVPQACIDMNKVIDVSDAEELTGNLYSLAISTEDGVHFVKATCREEAKWWMDMLTVFPKSKSRIKRTAAYSVVTKTVPTSSPGNNSIGSQSAQLKNVSRPNINNGGGPVKEICSRYIWTGNSDSLQSCSSSLDSESASSNRNKEIQKTPRICSEVCSNDKARNRRLQITREKQRIVKSATEPRTSFKQEDILPSWHDKKSTTTDVSRRLLIEDFSVECKMKDVPDSGTPHSRHSSSSFSSNQDPLRDVDISAHKQVRGDPDGCGLDLSTLRYSPSSELRMEPISEDLLNIKKGWLMKQGHDQQEWHKHWFVLRGSALLYYRDPTAEDQGILDGVIDLSVMNNISEVQVARNYGFQITSWDEKRYVLSAVTAGIRINWITAIKRAAGLQDDSSSIADADKEIPSTPRSMLLSSDEEYRTASENGRRESSSDWGETLPPSPPLNRTPISRVKERARGVTRTRIYNSRNSKSSPPSSRRSTLDSIRHDVLTPCVEVNLQEKTDRSLPMSKKLEKQAIELEDVKRQLTSALRQLSSAEEELLRLRQRQQDIAALEKQMADMMQSLKRAEEALNQKSCELSDYESFKKRYMEEKTAWDEELRVTECELHDTEERYSELCCELATSREHVDQLRTELAIVKERLTRGIEENESLYRRIRELEGRTVPASSMRESKGRSLDSLSDLTNIDFDLDVGRLDKERLIDEYENVRVRFEKAVQEIKAMKKELRESHTQTDCLEISLINARQQLKSKQQFYESQATMMAARIEDLTGKLFSAEKQIRSLKQKLSKSENREKKRSLSLKGRESYAMCKELEEKLLLLERKISVLNGEEVSRKNKPSVACNEAAAAAQQRTGEVDSTCKEALSSKMRRKSLDSAISSEPMKILIRMNCLEAKVAQASQNVLIKQSDEYSSSTNEETVDEDRPERSAILNEAGNIENLLRKKLTDIYAKQRLLRDTGRLTNEGKLNIMAEKLAYESVLICRLHDILSGSNDLDVADTERLMNELDRKLNGEQFVTKTSLEYFASSLSQYLMQIGRASDKCAAKRKRSHLKYRDKNNAVVKTLQKKSSVLSRRVNEFIRENAEELLSAAVTNDSTVSVVNENDSERFKNVKELVQESVNQRLIQAEITQLMLHCTSGAGYAPICNKTEKQSDGRSVEYLMMDRANLEQWTDNAMNVLNGEVDNAIELLKEKYRQKLSGWPNKKVIGCAKGSHSNVSLLQQFVDIIAHKVLLDARLLMISRKNELTHSSEGGHHNENSDTTDGNLSPLDEAAIVAEVQFLYAKLQNELQLSNDEKRVFDSLESVGTEVSALCSSVEDLFRRRSFSENSCIEWKDERGKYDDSNSSSESSWLDGVCRKCTEIKEQIINLQSCLQQSPECQKCLYLQDQLQKKEQDYENEKLQLEKQHQDDLLALKNEFEIEKKSLINKYEQEERLLREKSRKLEKKLDTLDSEYTQQMDNLRYSYKSSTSPSYEADCHSKDENVRQRYQEEIEQLRGLCEKGLSAMDNSHRRIIAELEEKHRQEIEALKLEKEQALAEETQATLAALDAMRKAHEAEVQKEISKFKSEYLKKVQSNHDIVAMHKEHEAEMEEIKKEILSLSEKYSTKCVESASLEEELRSANNQLAQAQQHIMQLDSRNKQLRAHLISDAAQEGVVNSELYQQLDEKSKEIIELRKQLTVHDDTLNALYTHLSNGRVDEAVINPLLEKLKCILVNGRRSNTAGLKKKGHRPLQHRSSLCGVNGMVAERKKIFET